MKIDLTGRTALVSGSTQGIGAAIAVGLARAGARVGVNGRDAKRVEDSVARLAEQVPGADLVPVAADVTGEEGARRATEALPQVDILVNNLGIFGSEDPLRITDEEWRRYFEVNVLAAVRLTRLFLPGMTERGWGRVQYIASDSAVVIPAEIGEEVAKRAKRGVLTVGDNRFVGVGSLNVVFRADPHAVLPRRLPDLETHADTAFDLIHSVGITPRTRQPMSVAGEQ